MPVFVCVQLPTCDNSNKFLFFLIARNVFLWLVLKTEVKMHLVFIRTQFEHFVVNVKLGYYKDTPRHQILMLLFPV